MEDVDVEDSDNELNKSETESNKSDDTDNESTSNSDEESISESDSDLKKIKEKKRPRVLSSSESDNNLKEKKLEENINTKIDNDKINVKVKEINKKNNIQLLEGKNIDNLVKINRDVYRDLMKQLYAYQVPDVQNMVHGLSKHKRYLNLGDTGVGKTKNSLLACRILKLRPFIICPKKTIPAWRKELKKLKCKHYGIANYDILTRCKYFPAKSTETTECPYIKRVSDESGSFIWKLPQDIILIFDEAHKCKNIKTHTSKLLQTASLTSCAILNMSATIANSPKTFLVSGLTLRFYKTIKEGKLWLHSLEKKYGDVMLGINKTIFYEYATRLRIKDLGDLFPKNQVIAQCFEMDDAEKIQEQYRIFEEAKMASGKEQNALAEMQQARMQIELLKIPFIIDQCKDFVEEGYSVAIFVNYVKTIKKLSKKLGTTCIVDGQRSESEVQQNIKDYMADRERIILVNIQSGGTGLSLNDIHGKYPRRAIINPTPSGQDFLQVFGRSGRANSVTPTIQYVIFCSGTVEEKVCENLKEKIENITMLNDASTESERIKGFEKIKTTRENKIKVIKNNIEDQSKNNEKSFDELHQQLTTVNIKIEHLEKELKEAKDLRTSINLAINHSIIGSDNEYDND